jgi:hypothetical protein
MISQSFSKMLTLAGVLDKRLKKKVAKSKLACEALRVMQEN